MSHCTRSYVSKKEKKKTLSVGNRGRVWDLPFKDVQSLGISLPLMGRGFKEQIERCRGGRAKEKTGYSFWHKDRPEDVTISLLKVMRQPSEKKTKKGSGAQKKKPRDLEPLVLETPVEDKETDAGNQG